VSFVQTEDPRTEDRWPTRSNDTCISAVSSVSQQQRRYPHRGPSKAGAEHVEESRMSANLLSVSHGKLTELFYSSIAKHTFATHPLTLHLGEHHILGYDDS